jgi:hypothetical protein
MKPIINAESGILNIVTPVGVAASKNPFTLVARKDRDGNPIPVKRGTKKGEQSYGQEIGLAVSKTDPEWPEFFQALKHYAETTTPGLTANPKYAIKIKCGDTDRSILDPAGWTDPEFNPLACRKGCWMIWITAYHGTVTPAITFNAAQGAYESVSTQGIEPKPGDRIRVLLDVSSNGITGFGDAIPGLYIGPQKILFVAAGEPIEFEGSGQGSVDAPTAFDAYLAPGMESVVTQPAPAPAPTPAPTPASQEDFMAGKIAAPPNAVQPPPPSTGADVPLYQYGPAGAMQGQPSADALVDAFTGAGWTVEQLKGAGYIL